MNHHRGRGRGRYTRQGSSGRWAQPQRNEERVAAQNAFNLAIHTGSTPEAAKAAGEAAANAIRMGRPYEEAVRAGVTAARAHADGASRRKSNRFSLRRSRSRCAWNPSFSHPLAVITSRSHSSRNAPNSPVRPPNVAQAPRRCWGGRRPVMRSCASASTRCGSTSLSSGDRGGQRFIEPFSTRTPLQRSLRSNQPRSSPMRAFRRCSRRSRRRPTPSARWAAKREGTFLKTAVRMTHTPWILGHRATPPLGGRPDAPEGCRGDRHSGQGLEGGEGELHFAQLLSRSWHAHNEPPHVRFCVSRLPTRPRR